VSGSTGQSPWPPEANLRFLKAGGLEPPEANVGRVDRWPCVAWVRAVAAHRPGRVGPGRGWRVPGGDGDGRTDSAVFSPSVARYGPILKTW